MGVAVLGVRVAPDLFERSADPFPPLRVVKLRLLDEQPFLDDLSNRKPRR
jgi:hypothetical protein